MLITVISIYSIISFTVQAYMEFCNLPISLGPGNRIANCLLNHSGFQQLGSILPENINLSFSLQSAMPAQIFLNAITRG